MSHSPFDAFSATGLAPSCGCGDDGTDPRRVHPADRFGFTRRILANSARLLRTPAPSSCPERQPGRA